MHASGNCYEKNYPRRRARVRHRPGFCRAHTYLRFGHTGRHRHAYPDPVRELLNDISVITQEGIQRSGQSILPELLRTQPGVEFVVNGGAGTSTSVYLRGANKAHTLVLVDGMRMNSVTSGETALGVKSSASKSYAARAAIFMDRRQLVG